jgi:predicted nucleotidyltransferase
LVGRINLIYSLLRVLFAASFFSAPAFSGVAENVNISIPEWVKTSRVNAKLNAAGVPRRVAIVKRVENQSLFEVPIY